jgi:hypothetical protein
MKIITKNYYLLLKNLKITHYGYVTHKPSESPNTPSPLMGEGEGGGKKNKSPPSPSSPPTRGGESLWAIF